ncbi:MAG TPA: hypothetical protein VNE00_23935 [Paraburkholderia sp.]|nr:hypothetical protein [Paraburkholderia sp.]
MAIGCVFDITEWAAIKKEPDLRVYAWLVRHAEAARRGLCAGIRPAAAHAFSRNLSTDIDAISAKRRSTELQMHF